MHIVRTIDELSEALRGSRPAFVPTMGALHAGHLALIQRATEIALPADVEVVVSIFVNPTQFGPTEDFTRYPRQLEADTALAAAGGATIIFAPAVEVMYPPGQSIATPPLPAVATQPRLEEAFRPTHFAGVCQVVARLFDLVQPSTAIFGEKDYQQLQVISAMVKNDNHRWPGLQVVPHPTIREPDGLAMSSRNAYLTQPQRQQALGLSRALNAARSLAKRTDDTNAIESAMREMLDQHKLVVDYAVIRSSTTLMPLSSVSNARGLIAAKAGNVRLIDNMAIQD